MRDDGGQVRVDLPEDWVAEIVERMGAELDVISDFAGGIRRTGNVEGLRRRIETRGLLG